MGASVLDIGGDNFSSLSESTSGLMGILAGTVGIVIAIVALVLYIVQVVGMWKLFSKAGVPGWLSLIPVVNTIGYVKVATGSAVKTLFLLIPVFGEIYAIMLPFKMARSFGKSFGFGVGLLFINWLFTLILAYGKAEYVRK